MQDKARHRPETFTPRAANTQGPCFKKSPHLFRPLFPPNSSTKGFLHVNFLTALLTQGNQPISLNYPSQNWTTAQSNIHIVRLSEWIDSSLCFSLMGTNPCIGITTGPQYLLPKRSACFYLITSALLGKFQLYLHLLQDKLLREKVWHLNVYHFTQSSQPLQVFNVFLIHI